MRDAGVVAHDRPAMRDQLRQFADGKPVETIVNIRQGEQRGERVHFFRQHFVAETGDDKLIRAKRVTS